MREWASANEEQKSKTSAYTTPEWFHDSWFAFDFSLRCNCDLSNNANRIIAWDLKPFLLLDWQTVLHVIFLDSIALRPVHHAGHCNSLNLLIVKIKDGNSKRRRCRFICNLYFFVYAIICVHLLENRFTIIAKDKLEGAKCAKGKKSCTSNNNNNDNNNSNSNRKKS